MKIEELEKKTTPELEKLLSEEREKVRDLRFRVHAKQYKDVRSLRAARRVVARILTVLQQQRTAPAKQTSATDRGVTKEKKS